MNLLRLTATELKRNTAEVINAVVYAEKEAIIERYGYPVVRIVPIIKISNKLGKEKLLKKYFGVIKNFPNLKSLRKFTRRSVDL